MAIRTEGLFPNITEEFREFIISLLKRGKIKQKSIDKFSDDEAMIKFRTAFIHKTYNIRYNYETLEFRGDGILANIAEEYLKERFPLIISTEWLTRLEQNYTSKPALAKFAERAGFFKHILYGQKVKEELEKYPLPQNREYQSLLEDTFEAFCGATVEVIDERTRRGVGYAVIYNIVASFLDEEEMSLDYFKVFDAFTILKEQIYDTNKWLIGKLTRIDEITEDDRKFFNVVIKAPLTDIRTGRQFFRDVGYGKAPSKGEAKQIAARQAIVTLKGYGYTVRAKDPYGLN